MIYETIPDVGGQSSERMVATYRLWQCLDCGLRFSMMTREEPAVCPRCLQPRATEPECVTLVKDNAKLRERVKFLENRFLTKAARQGGLF